MSMFCMVCITIIRACCCLVACLPHVEPYLALLSFSRKVTVCALLLADQEENAQQLESYNSFICCMTGNNNREKQKQGSCLWIEHQHLPVCYCNKNTNTITITHLFVMNCIVCPTVATTPSPLQPQQQHCTTTTTTIIARSYVSTESTTAPLEQWQQRCNNNMLTCPLSGAGGCPPNVPTKWFHSPICVWCTHSWWLLFCSVLGYAGFGNRLPIHGADWHDPLV